MREELRGCHSSAAELRTTEMLWPSGVCLTKSSLVSFWLCGTRPSWVPGQIADASGSCIHPPRWLLLGSRTGSNNWALKTGLSRCSHEFAGTLRWPAGALCGFALCYCSEWTAGLCLSRRWTRLPSETRWILISHPGRSRANRTSDPRAGFPKISPATWCGPACRLTDWVPRAGRIFILRPALPRGGNRTGQCSTSRHWRSRISWGTHHRIRTPGWSVWTRGSPGAKRFCPCSEPLRRSAASRTPRCSSLCPRNLPGRGNWYLALSLRSWRAPSSHGTARECRRKL